MPSKKRKSTGVEFVRGFVRPSDQDIADAVGTYPWGKYTNHREEILSKVTTSSLASIREIDCPQYYRNEDVLGRPIWPDLPVPLDEGSWLANVLEKGQTVTSYISDMTLRSGRFRPKANAESNIIYVIPIVAPDDELQWPVTAPPLLLLSNWLGAFFDRKCVIADFATLSPSSSSATWCAPDGRMCQVRGRISSHSDRFQTHVEGLLNNLQEYKQRGDDNKGNLQSAFAVVGVTMLDLYSGRDDLFIAGMASPCQGVAVLSFARYHPHLKMCPFHWDDIGYISKASYYSYYEDNKRRPRTVSQMPPFDSMDKVSRTEYTRRAGKLLVHEICHVFGLEHCIYYHCLMNGTGEEIVPLRYLVQ